MNRSRFLIVLACLWLLQGCAAVVVGGVAAGAATVHDRRTAGSVVEDQSIEIQASDRLHEDGGPGRGNHIKSISYNQIVLLAGEVRVEADRDRAEAIVAAIPKVRRVVNEIAIRPRTGAYTRSRDSVLTAQVKSSFLAMNEIEGFDAARIKVVSVRGQCLPDGAAQSAGIGNCCRSCQSGSWSQKGGQGLRNHPRALITARVSEGQPARPQQPLQAQQGEHSGDDIVHHDSQSTLEVLI